VKYIYIIYLEETGLSAFCVTEMSMLKLLLCLQEFSACSRIGLMHAKMEHIGAGIGVCTYACIQLVPHECHDEALREEGWNASMLLMGLCAMHTIFLINLIHVHIWVEQLVEFLS